MRRYLAVGLVLAAVAFAATPVWAADVCPEAGKVESQVDGDLDNIVLDAGTLVCIKGATDMVTVTADGVKTLKVLLGSVNPGNGELRSVSHYTVISTTTTTTQPEETTTTTIADTTTTTVEATTTTSSGETSTTAQETTSTTVQTPTTSIITVTPSDPGDPVLPFTGSNVGALLGAALALVASGGLIVRKARA